MPSDDVLVLSANQAFYDAFSRGDLAGIEALWARRAPVACIHPGWDALHGRDEVMASWRAILHGAGAPAISCSNAVAVVLGDSAYVLCREAVRGGRLVATNLFVREGDRWKIVHHQAGPVASNEPDPEPEGEPEPDPDLPDDGGTVH